jgi:hypothetical protein
MSRTVNIPEGHGFTGFKGFKGFKGFWFTFEVHGSAFGVSFRNPNR